MYKFMRTFGALNKAISLWFMRPAESKPSPFVSPLAHQLRFFSSYHAPETIAYQLRTLMQKHHLRLSQYQLAHAEHHYYSLEGHLDYFPKYRLSDNEHYMLGMILARIKDHYEIEDIPGNVDIHESITRRVEEEMVPLNEALLEEVNRLLETKCSNIDDLSNIVAAKPTMIDHSEQDPTALACN